MRGESGARMRFLIYGEPDDDVIREIERRLREEWTTLRRDEPTIELRPPNYAQEHVPGVGDLHLYLTGGSGSLPLIEAAVKAGEIVIPIVADAPAAASLPGALRRFNAFRRDAHREFWCEALIDEALTFALLSRRTRRVFISYRRIDSEAIAHQLHEAYVDLGYEVFLDSVSINAADDFQHELMWWLNDADIVVLLASPRLGQSDWIRQEVEFAKAANLGMVIVGWPAACFGAGKPAPFIGQPLDPRAKIGLTLADLGLADDDPAAAALFADGAGPVRTQVTNAVRDLILARTLDLRTRSILERRADLLGQVELEEKKAGATVTPGASPGDLVSRRSSGERLIRVSPCRPEARTIHATAEAAKGQPATFVYPENLPNDPRARAMQWLVDREAITLRPFTGKQEHNDR
jgi:hypothetical protein